MAFRQRFSSSKDMDATQRPINQNGLGTVCVPHTSNKLMFCNAFISLKNFSKEELKRNFEFYESFTVHESSLSPCVHSIQAASLDKMDMAYTFT
jgi:maltose phosphorylase